MYILIGVAYCSREGGGTKAGECMGRGEERGQERNECPVGKEGNEYMSG